MGIGIPVDFSSFFKYFSQRLLQKAQEFSPSYMLTMTGFSMSSLVCSLPYMLQEDRIEHWLTYIEHSKVSIAAYYLSKIFRVLLNFMVAIIVTFVWELLFEMLSCLVRLARVRCSYSNKSGFLAFGLLIAQIKSQQIMSLVANIIYLVLPIVSGSWVPISMFLSGFRVSLVDTCLSCQ